MAIPNIKEYDIVLFLGAGFSCDAALPLMREAGDPSRKDNENLPIQASAQRNSQDFRYAAPMLVESWEIFQKFQQFCQQSPTFRDRDVNNVENIFCIAEAMAESGVDCIELDKQEYKISQLIRHIQLWLWKVYHQLPIYDKEKAEYERLLNSLLKSEISNNFAVITTNYDLVFEYLLWKKNKPCHYPCEAESFSLGGGTEPFAHLGNQNIKGPLLCKMHGSINFFQDDPHSDKLYVANLLGGDKPIGKSNLWKNKPAILAVDAIWSIHQAYGNNFSPAIIPPTYAKLTQQSWLKNIWHAALEIIINAKKIIFIGYSMPDSDGFMRALIHSAFAIRASKPNFAPPQVFVIDPSQSTHQRYQDLFHETYKSLPLLTFSEATKSIIPEILNKTNY
jgi:hypothetical protein